MKSLKELLSPRAAGSPDDYSADRPAGAPSGACQICGCESSPKRQRIETGVYSPYPICADAKACDQRVMDAARKRHQVEAEKAAEKAAESAQEPAKAGDDATPAAEADSAAAAGEDAPATEDEAAGDKNS